MGCPCSKRTHERQSGSQAEPQTQAESAGHPSRGYHWNGPERRTDPEPPATPPADE